jgi:hypothetical protein
MIEYWPSTHFKRIISALLNTSTQRFRFSFLPDPLAGKLRLPTLLAYLQHHRLCMSKSEYPSA